jgi:anti-sigma regulatory factor (Ser/Thr protein kinase)
MSGGGKKTVFSLKDQSGHSVNCLLRSIVTDFFHNQLLAEHSDFDVAEIYGRLNSAICKADFFADDDFCTAFGAELIHADLKFNYLSAGHPPMLLIRQGKVIKLPGEAGDLRNLPLAVLPDVAFQAGTVQLRHGDKLIIYTDGLNALPKGDPLRQQELIDLMSDIVGAMPKAPVSGLVRELLNRLGAFAYDRCRTAAEGESHTAEKDNSVVRGGLTDDLSILALEIEGRTAVHTKELSPADFKNFEDFLEAVNDCLPIEINKNNKVRMAVAEAVINAWRHGNGEDYRKAVGLRCWQGNDWNVEVVDRGAGFNPATVPDPTLGENLLSEAGRGIFTMRKFCAWLRWRDGGRKVILSFDCNSPGTF